MYALKLLPFLVVLAVSPLTAQPNNTADPQQKTNAQQRGPEQASLVLKIDDPSKAQTQSDGSAQERPPRPIISSTAIGIGTIVVYSLQFIALVGTWWVMIRNSRRQLCAYVLPERGGIVDGTMLNPPQNHRAGVPGCYMLIKNGGQTPAYKVKSWANIAVIPVTNESMSLNLPPLSDAFALTLGGGASFTKSIWFDRPLTANEITDISTGVRAIYLYGRVEYVDAFKRKRFTNFRLQYIGQFPPHPEAIFNFSEKGNDAD